MRAAGLAWCGATRFMGRCEVYIRPCDRERVCQSDSCFFITDKMGVVRIDGIQIRFLEKL